MTYIIFAFWILLLDSAIPLDKLLLQQLASALTHFLACVALLWGLPLLVSILSPVPDTVVHNTPFTSYSGLDDSASSGISSSAISIALNVSLLKNSRSSILDSSRHLLLNLRPLLTLAIALFLLFHSCDLIPLLLHHVRALASEALVRFSASSA